MRFLLNRVILSVGLLLILGTLGLGEFIFWRVLKVSCSNDQVIQNNTPLYFVTDGRDQGPFRGERWNRWVGKDLSYWFLKNGEVEEIGIQDRENDLKLSESVSLEIFKKAIKLINGDYKGMHLNSFSEFVLILSFISDQIFSSRVSGTSFICLSLQYLRFSPGSA